jgi:type III restriction enzyme
LESKPIPYEYEGMDHSYTPDFVVVLANGVKLILEIKGYEIHGKQQTDSKHNSARKWVTAVNNLGDFGKWDFLVCRDLKQLLACLTELASGKHVEDVLDEGDGEFALKPNK